MTVATGLIIALITKRIIYSLFICPVIFWGYAWIEQHYISEYINGFIGKIMKIDIE